MQALMIIALGLGPGFFWLWWFYKKDVLEPEPKALVIKTFVIGIFTAVPVVIVEMMIPVPRFFQIVLVAPVVEEFFKFATLKWYALPKKQFDEPMDGIVYAAAIALGFAAIENVGYMYQA